MARILTYSIDTVVTENDKWIGTDFAGGITKNFTPSKLVDYINESGSVGVAGQIAFKYYGTFTPPRPSGSITLNTFQPNFSAITTMKISSQTSGRKIIVDYLNTLEKTEILIVDSKNPNIFGKFYVSDISQDLIEPNFYNLTLEFIEGNGGLTDLSVYLVAFNSYVAGGDKNFVYTQSSPASTWIINHNLKKYPAVSVIDSGGNVVFGDVSYLSDNIVEVRFSASFSGHAYFN